MKKVIGIPDLSQRALFFLIPPMFLSPGDMCKPLPIAFILETATVNLTMKLIARVLSMHASTF